jgi:hypothetical protein
MGAAARSGRDKLTLVLPPSLEPFGLWIEQLVAESTGKHGVGIVPVAGEPAARTADYGADRFLARTRMRGERSDRIPDRDMVGPWASGLPVASFELAAPEALGAEFVRWEIATAVAGAILEINPFDEPNVQQAKNVTHTLLDRYQSEGRLPTAPPDRTTDEGIAIRLSTAARRALGDRRPEAILTLLSEGEYFALLAYLGPDETLAGALRGFRAAVLDRTRRATMFGYGPRYLHSTGQLHKGGPNTGVFVVITATPRADVDIPGQRFSFGTLEQAQALGDFRALDAADRRVLHAHLPTPDAALIATIGRMLLAELDGRT